MAKKITKPTNVEITCKETLSKKKAVSVRKSAPSAVGKSRPKCETKKLVNKLKAVCAVSSETTVDVTSKMRKSKVITYAEARFKCPTPTCKYVVSRYQNLFDHFSDHYRPEGFERFRW